MDIDYSIHYMKYHESSDEHYSIVSANYIHLFAPILSKISKDALILDVGCGIGLLVNSLRSAGYHGTRGVDISDQQIREAKRRNLPCELVGASYMKDISSTASGSLDVIFLIDVLEHLEIDKQIEFLKDARRLLKPNGSIVITVPNANSNFAMRWRYNDWTHKISFTEDSLDFVLRNAGYSLLKFHPYEFGTKLKFPYIHSIRFWMIFARKLFRLVRRTEALAEFGRAGLNIPLSINLLVEARIDNEVF